jgi:glutathione S-transferase
MRYRRPRASRFGSRLRRWDFNYQPVAVDLRMRKHKTDAFMATDPIAKVRVLVDRWVLEGTEVVLSEAAPIPVHQAEMTGRLLPKDDFNRGNHRLEHRQLRAGDAYSRQILARVFIPSSNSHRAIS